MFGDEAEVRAGLAVVVIRPLWRRPFTVTAVQKRYLIGQVTLTPVAVGRLGAALPST
jgi:hypothetical protein